MDAQKNDRQLQLWLRDNKAALKGLVSRVASFNEQQRYEQVMAMLPGEILIGEEGSFQLNTLKLKVHINVLGQMLNLPDLCRPLLMQK